MGSVSARLRRLVRPPYGASLSAVVLSVLCVAGVVVLHLARPDLDPLQHVLSEYANGSLGFVMTGVFYAAGLTCVALGWRLRTALPWRGITVAVPPLLVVAGFGMITSGVFEVGLPMAPESVAETIHSIASIGAFVSLIAAMALFAWACRAQSDWRNFRLVATTLAGLAITAAVVSPLADRTAWSGAAQRVLAGTVVLWLLLTALRVRTIAFSKRG
jgi:hypothetical protein